jgi:hypothetical protein
METATEEEDEEEGVMTLMFAWVRSDEGCLSDIMMTTTTTVRNRN